MLTLISNRISTSIVTWLDNFLDFFQHLIEITDEIERSGVDTYVLSLYNPILTSKVDQPTYTHKTYHTVTNFCCTQAMYYPESVADQMSMRLQTMIDQEATGVSHDVLIADHCQKEGIPVSFDGGDV
jgi:hypothetical protein